MKPERKLEIALIKEFEAHHWFAHHFDVLGLDGWPDIIAVHNKTFLLIECKAGAKIRASQRAFFEYMVKQHGVIVHIADSSQPGFDAKEWVDAAIKTSNCPA